MENTIKREPRIFKPVLRWPGGKTRMLKHLLPMVPKHVCYCEPFAGGLAILMRKPRSKVEVVNDINGDLIALYRCIQYHNEELIREVGHMVASRQTIKDYMRNPGLTDIQRAARFYCRNRTSFAGSGTSFGVSKTNGGSAFSIPHNCDLLGQARERLSGVLVENVSYERCMALYDSPDTFMFLDPPYLNADIRAYDGWTEAHLKTFRDHVAKLKSKWVVTLDDSPFVRDLFQGCVLKEISTPNRCVNNRLKPDAVFRELIITRE